MFFAPWEGRCFSQKLYKRFVNSSEDPPQEYYDRLGRDRDYNVDLVPKFIMSDGKLVDVLVKTDVKRYLDFKPIDACYVFSQSAQKGWFSSGHPGCV